MMIILVLLCVILFGLLAVAGMYAAYNDGVLDGSRAVSQRNNGASQRTESGPQDSGTVMERKP